VARTIRRRPLASFFLVFGITWAAWIPRAGGAPLGAVGLVWTWAPAIAALLAAVLTGGRPVLRDLWSRLVRWRVGWRWYAVVLTGPAAFSLSVAALYALLGGSWEAATPTIREGFLVLLPLLFLILALTDGLGEEVAWRGFALPRLLAQHNALVASLILGMLWGLWHLPLVWTEGAPLYHQPVWLLLLDVAAKFVLFTWVFLHTRGSVLLAVLLHASTNLFVVSPVVAESADVALLLLAAAAKWILVVTVIAVGGAALRRVRDRSRCPRPIESRSTLLTESRGREGLRSPYAASCTTLSNRD
jgi:membrane protease YdiL (CAAX protease family)